MSMASFLMINEPFLKEREREEAGGHLPSVYIPLCLLIHKNKPMATPARNVTNKCLQPLGVCAMLPLWANTQLSWMTTWEWLAPLTTTSLPSGLSILSGCLHPFGHGHSKRPHFLPGSGWRGSAPGSSPRYWQWVEVPRQHCRPGPIPTPRSFFSTLCQ